MFILKLVALYSKSSLKRKHYHLTVDDNAVKLLH